MPDFACMMLWRCRQLGSQKFSCALTFHLHRSLVSGGRAGTCWNSPIFKEPNITIVSKLSNCSDSNSPRREPWKNKRSAHCDHRVSPPKLLPPRCQNLGSSPQRTECAPAQVPIILYQPTPRTGFNLGSQSSQCFTNFRLWWSRFQTLEGEIKDDTYIRTHQVFGVPLPRFDLVTQNYIFLDPFGVTRSRLRSFHHGDMVSVEHGWAMKFDSIFISTFLRCSIHSKINSVYTVCTAYTYIYTHMCSFLLHVITHIWYVIYDNRINNK